MNRKLIALAVAAAAALPLTAQAAPKVYGKLNLSVEQYNESFSDPATPEVEMVRLQSNDSRFGVKGEDELTATLSGVYGIEWAVAGDAAGGASDLVARNRFLGLKHQSFGTIKMGAYDTYLKLSQGKADFFNDLFGDMKYVIAGENRVSNVVGYESPKFLGGLQFNMMAQTQESNAGGTAKGSTNGNSASIIYDNSDMGLYVALAMDNNVVSSAALYSGRESDNMRAVVVYKIADLTLSGLYNVSEDATATGAVSDEETGMLVGAAYKIGDQVIKVQYGMAEADDSAADPQERTLMNVGVDHNFNSKTRAYAFYTVKEEAALAPIDDLEQTSFGLGVEHNF